MGIIKTFYLFLILLLCISISGCANKTGSNDNIPSDQIITINTSNERNLTITFINVGQADSEWIVSPSGKTILIDAGEDQQAVNITSVLKKNEIDMLIVTHPHSDHIGGIQTILNNYYVYEFVDNGYKHNSAMYTSMMKTVTKKNISHMTVTKGDYITFGEMGIRVLNPQKTFFTELNDNSIVMLMTYKNVSILFTGDAGRSAEDVYAQSIKNVDVLKVSHHGSSTGTGSYLLSKINPKISIISVGKNTYGHPDKSVISNLIKDGSIIYRTDLNGTTVLTTNGEQYSVTTNN